MGLNVDEIKFLLWAKSEGVDFTKVMMLGRHGLHLDAASMRSVLSAFGISKSEFDADAIFTSQTGYHGTFSGYAEPFLKFLGAVETSSIDASSYEGATHILDMNQPIAQDLKERFTVVLDSGTLEHIFNFPTAIRNCMEMVQLNGHFIAIAPCNNHAGHGFYQFSPELFFRVFDEQNGFKVKRMILFEAPSMGTWYELQDPEEMGKRVEFRTWWRHCHLAVLARRTSIKPIFGTTPQQSDYSQAWRAHEQSAKSGGQAAVEQPSAANRIRRSVPQPIKKVCWKLMEFATRMTNPGAFKVIRVPESK
jgi:hypothetical protein